MDKLLTVTQKRADKHPKNKKNKPLKIVYITNPIKITATVSEFRARVQQLTGQDADFSEFTNFAVADGVGGSQGEVVEAGKMAVEKNNVHAVEEVSILGQTFDGEVVENGLDPSTSGSYFNDDDAFYTAKMMENFPGLMAAYQWHEGAHNFDELKSLIN